MQFYAESPAQSPARRSAGHVNRTCAKIVYAFKAKLQKGQVFSRDICGAQEVIVNPLFDWGKMQPAHASTTGRVLVCCCVPRGVVTLSCDFDKAAYAAGETVQVSGSECPRVRVGVSSPARAASALHSRPRVHRTHAHTPRRHPHPQVLAKIINASKNDVHTVRVKLMRFMDLSDRSGARKRITDTVSQADYPGVKAGETQDRHLPLSLQGQPGVFLPATAGRLVQVSYLLEVEAGIRFAFDIETRQPVVIYLPAPSVWGGEALLQGGGLLPVSPQPQQLVMPQQGAMGMPQQQQAFYQPPAGVQPVAVGVQPVAVGVEPVGLGGFPPGPASPGQAVATNPLQARLL